MITVEQLMDEFEALTPLIEQAKAGTKHRRHIGWSLAGDPHTARCICGVPLSEFLEGFAE